MRKLTIYGVATALLLGSVAAVADAVVTTPREELVAFGQAVTGKVSSRRIDAALSYADPNRFAVRVSTDANRVFDEGNAQELSDYAYRALAPLRDEALQLIQQSVTIDGNDSVVALRVRTSAGFVNAVFRLQRSDDRWWVRSVQLS